MSNVPQVYRTLGPYYAREKMERMMVPALNARDTHLAGYSLSARLTFLDVYSLTQYIADPQYCKPPLHDCLIRVFGSGNGSVRGMERGRRDRLGN